MQSVRRNNSRLNTSRHGGRLSTPSPIGATVKALLTVLLVVLAFVAITVLNALTILRPANIANAIAEADVSWLLDEIGLSEGIVDIVNRTTVPEYAPGVGNVDISGVTNFLRRENVKKELGKAVDGYVSAFVEGDYSHYITAEEIVGSLKALSPDMRNEFGVTLTDDDYKAIADMLNRNELEAYSLNSLLNELNKANVGFAMPYDRLSSIISNVFSVYPLIIVSIICVVLGLSIFLLHRKRVRLAFLYIGIPTVLSGLMYMAVGLLGPFSGMVRNGGLYSAARFFSGFSNYAFSVGSVCLAIGLASFLVYFAMGSLSGKYA